MSLYNVNAVDAVGTDQASGELVLSVIDGWDWGEEPAHILALQAKLNPDFAYGFRPGSDSGARTAHAGTRGDGH